MKAPDDNDRLRAGSLPLNPGADTEPLLEQLAREATAAQSRADHARQMYEEAARTEGRRAREEFEAHVPPLARVAEAFWTRQDARRRGLLQPLPSPWPSLLSPLGGGFWPGLYVLVGATGSGKTQWALQLSLQAAKVGAPVLYLALELGTDEIYARLLGMEANQGWASLLRGQTSPAAFAAAQDHLLTLERLPLHIHAGSPYGFGHGELFPLVQAFLAHYPPAGGALADARGSASPAVTGAAAGSAALLARPLPPLVVLDFLQLVAGDRGEDSRTRIQQAAYVGRSLARELGCVVLLVSATARQNYETTMSGGGQGSPAQLVGLGKESGEVEYAADAVFVLARNPQDPPGGVQLAIAKNRAGPTAWIGMHFDGLSFREQAAHLPQRMGL